MKSMKQTKQQTDKNIGGDGKQQPLAPLLPCVSGLRLRAEAREKESIFMCLCVCMYTHIYIYIYTYMYVHRLAFAASLALLFCRSLALFLARSLSLPLSLSHSVPPPPPSLFLSLPRARGGPRYSAQMRSISKLNLTDSFCVSLASTLGSFVQSVLGV